MPNRIPDEDTISNAIRSVMNKNSHIETQTEFLKLVRKELSKEDEDYRVSGERIRKIGVERGIIRISIEYRESDIEGLPHICPVCKNAMSPLMNRSLDGDSVEIKRKCTVCSYTVGRKMLVPGRYTFSRSRDGELTPQEHSFRKLRRAGALIREAAGIIEEVVDGTEFKNAGYELASILKETADSDTYSIKSLSFGVKQSVSWPAEKSQVTRKKRTDRKDK
ncbi:MAG: hypothetical protein FWG41_03040 [Methanomassiliicoccaceae archaeon]|nr:hypothetical protein [Methanomassiliicoccaceae archaeon]